MKKNIVIITDYAAPYEGNFIASMKALEIVARKKEDSLKFLFPQRAKSIDWVKKMAEVYRVEFFPEGMGEIIKSLKKSMVEGEKNIVYSHFARHKTQVAIKLFRMVHPKIKLVQHFHNHCKIPNGFSKKQMMRLAYRLYEGDLNIGCSKSVMESMPYRVSKNTFVDNAIDFKRLEGNTISHEIKKQMDEFVVLMFGFDYDRKGVDIAIKALKEIAEEKKIILAISLASNREKVENRIKSELGEIPSWIRLLPPSERVSEYYRGSDLFLSAAREEGFCYALVEATYCGKRCVSSKIGGVPLEIPGMICFESGNAEELKHKILEAMVQNEDKMEEAKQYIMERYDLKVWADQIMENLENVE